MPSPSSSGITTDALALGPTGVVAIDALVAGKKWGGAVGTGTSLSYSFPFVNGSAVFSPGSNGTYSNLNEPSATYHYGLNTTQQAAASGALTAWGNVANISFQQVTDTTTNVGDIRFAWTSATEPTSTGVQAWGWAAYPDPHYPSGGDVWISTLSSGASDPSWAVGSYNYNALIHETGHALGLKHPFEGTGTFDVLPVAQDTRQYSVMSYTDHPHSLFVRVTQTSDGWHSSSINVVPDTPMLDDIKAIQYLYGANMSYKTGDDTYTFDPATPFFRTLWDAGGKDTISVANFSKGCIIDLNPGHFSKITIESDTSPPGVVWSSPLPIATYDGTDNLAIAYNCFIENAIGGTGNDTLIGTGAGNQLTGGAGNDALDGGAGLDTAIYRGARGNFRLTKTGTGYTVQDNTGAEGTDTLANIERLQFSTTKLAIDLDGNAGTTAKILGAVFGKASVAIPQYVGIGLGYLDGGTSYTDLMQFALNAAKVTTHQSEVNLLWTNLFGSAPTAAQAKPYVDMLDSGSVSTGALGVLAADQDLNKLNINLVGLQQTGLEYS
jgi:serralysin